MNTETQEMFSFKVQRIEVVPARPSEAELRKIRQHKTAAAEKAEEEVIYLVKIYLDKLPEPTGIAYPLYVGEQQIRKYTEFPGGIYFKLYDPGMLEKMAGQKVRFGSAVKPGFIDTDQDFPDVNAAELLRDTQKVRKELPTRQEELSK